MNKYEKLNQLKDSKSICLIGHINPDADALASMVVLRDFLKEYFKIKRIDLFADCKETPKNCVEILDKIKLSTATKKYDTAIMLDSPKDERLGQFQHLFQQSKFKIVIDHHQTNEYQGDINIVEMVSSTCEIVYSIMKYFKYKTSSANQGKIYAGIITDTNNLTVGKFGQRTFKILSEIIDNINHEAIYANFFGNNTLKNMQLLSLAIINTITLNHGKILLSHITKEEATKFKATPDDYTGIINRLQTVSNSLLICFIYPKDQQYYVSMRAKNGLKVSSLAKHNGGGGHDGAAAFLTDKSLSEIEYQIMEDFTKILENSHTKKTKLFF